jgi:3'(2'), 5'-bisphosphate nucleotidase
MEKQFKSMPSTADPIISATFLESIIDIAREAGNAIMQIYQSENFDIQTKTDHSPLTKADSSSNAIIVSQLKKLYPDIPVISEENKAVPYELRKKWQRFWLIDPLDGTKEFIKRNGEFTINIALIENNIPVAGVVHIPATQITYYGGKNAGAYVIAHNKVNKLKAPPEKSYLEKQNIKVVASRSHLTDETKAFVHNLEKQGKKIEFVTMGSSLKICMIAEGLADVYPRFGPTMEWDTAAAQAIAEAAGRKVVIYDSRLPLRYNKENLTNPWFIVY